MCFSNWLTIHKVIIIVQHSCVIKNWYRAIATFFLNFMFHTVQQGFLRNGEKYHIYFIDNLLLFPTVKEFSKSVNR